MRVIVSFDDFVFKYDDLDEAPRALIFSDAPSLGQVRNGYHEMCRIGSFPIPEMS